MYFKNVKTKRTITIDGPKLYNRNSYLIGTRITTAQVPHRVGYLDSKSKLMFYDQWLEYDGWIWLVNKVRETLNLSPKDAAKYVNGIYQTKLANKDANYKHLAQYSMILRDTCGKWFSVVPSLMKV